MKVLFAAAEAYPLAKVGGLGDVAGSLPKALRALGHDARIAIPRYGMVPAGQDVGEFSVSMGGGTSVARLRTTAIDGVPVYLIDKPELYDRPKVYEYPDDGRRFGFFNRAALEACLTAGFVPDVVHCNDWHSALIPAFLKTTYASHPALGKTRSVLTIHNLQHQGLFGRDLSEWLGLPAECWTPEGVEFFGRLNFLKAGIVYSDRVNTVSPTYSREVQTEEYGCGLDGLLRSRGAKLSGILNGIDYDTWDPRRDPFLDRPYSKSSLEGKADNKRALQDEVGLRADPKTPLLGLVSRVTQQKGFDILLAALREILGLGVQFVLLGTGERPYEEALARAAQELPGLAAVLKYDERLAHRIYAGSDLFLMPSKFEPCGLGQMISLRYGTVPIVRQTGGLADTVVDATTNPAAGNGFVFEPYTPEALLDAVRRAIEAYRKGRGLAALRRRGMSADLSWAASARQYAALYGLATAEGTRASPP